VAGLSGIVITFNEERHIEAALASLSFCDERLVVDAGSTDRTVDIARAMGVRVQVSKPWPGFVAQRNLALGAACHDWVFFLDADERVTPALQAEIEALSQSGFDCPGYRVPRVARYLGRWIRGTDWYPDRQLRLFDRRRGQWEGGAVHESVRVEGPVGRLRGEILHYPYADITDHLRTIDRYTTLWADHAHAAGRRTGSFEMMGASAWAFVRNYWLRRGVFLGWPGLMVSVMAAFYTALKLAKLRERAIARSVES
jgi:glycosyltransferase involved in cell wall biosynthesis